MCGDDALQLCRGDVHARHREGDCLVEEQCDVLSVRVLPTHALLQPRHAWHQQDCKVREQARAAGSDTVAEGCDCTHYCYSPLFWRVYFRSLLEQLSGSK